jgi:hypothetical protein
VTDRVRWGELPGQHRRWILQNAVIATALINLAINAAIAWLSTVGRHRIPLWVAPLPGKTSTITDTVGTFFMLPFMTCLFCTTTVRQQRRAGRLAALTPTESERTRALLGHLSAVRWRRGLVFGGLSALAFSPPVVLLLVASHLGPISVPDFVLYKASLGVVLGAIVTPVIALQAMADAPCDATSASS